MNCDDAINLAVDSLMDEVTGDEQRRLDEHLRTCASCRDEAARLRATWSDLADLAAPPIGGASAVRFGRVLAERARPRWTPFARAAAMVVLFGGGAATGRWLVPSAGEPAPVEESRAPAPGLGEPAFLLLIRGDEPYRRATEAELVEKYTNWAVELDAAGRLVTAQKLSHDPGRWVWGSESESMELSGFFVVRATNYDEAEMIARESPHVTLGGAIEVRAIDFR